MCILQIIVARERNGGIVNKMQTDIDKEKLAILQSLGIITQCIYS